MQNLVAKSWKLTELLAVKFTVLKTTVALQLQHCNTCVILPINSLCHNEIIVNKNHGTFD